MVVVVVVAAVVVLIPIDCCCCLLGGLMSCVHVSNGQMQYVPTTIDLDVMCCSVHVSNTIELERKVSDIN